MKKKIISLLSAVSLMFSMAAFNAVSAAEIADEGYTLVYDAASSDVDTAAFELYVGAEGVNNVTAFSFKIKLNSDIFDIANTTGTKILAAEYSGNTNINKTTGIMQFTLANQPGGTVWDPAEPVAKWTVEIKEAYQGKEIDLNDFEVTSSTYKTYGNSAQLQLPYVLPVIPAAADPEPTVETVNADTVALAAPGENEVAGTDVAAAYKASYAFVSGQTAAWTATGKVDLPINMANISGETTLGLIVKDAAVSGVALKVTTPAN